MRVFQFLQNIFNRTSAKSTRTTAPTTPFEFKLLNEKLLLQQGGEQNCGILVDQDKVLLINTNAGLASEKLKEYVESALGAEVSHVICTNNLTDCQKGLIHYNYLDVYLPEPLDFSSDSGLKSHKYNIVTEDTPIEFGNHKLLIRPFKNTLGKNDFIVFFDDYCFWGGLFFNNTEPLILPQTNLENWIQALEKSLETFDRHIPGKGPQAADGDLRKFYEKLKALRLKASKSLG